MAHLTKKGNLKLFFRPLPACLIRNNFIKNFESNYEEYLTEFINNSRFVKDNKGKYFELNKMQSNNESDVENGFYQLDYKLLIDSDSMENIRNYSGNIAIDSNGVIGYSVSNKEGRYRNYYLKGILKNMQKEDLEYIENEKMANLTEFQKVVRKYLNKIVVEKNVLYFLPYNFFYKDSIMNVEKYNLIVENFSKDFKGFMDYRNSKVKKDTYMGFVSNNDFIILKYSRQFELYDVVNVNVSKKYMKLIDLNGF